MKLIILQLLIFASLAGAQELLTGKHQVHRIALGYLQNETVVNARLTATNEIVSVGFYEEANKGSMRDSGSVVWAYTEPAAIAEECAVSSNGKYCATGWMLNNHRISLYKNDNPSPVWEYPTLNAGYNNYVAISDTGGVIAAGSYKNIYIFSNTSPVPIVNFDLTQLKDTGIATGLALTGNGSFLVATVSRQDSSSVFGFNTGSATPVWKFRIRPSVLTGGASVQGVRISANDSLVIVNTYAEFFVISTFTGQLIYNGLINPSSPSSGTQAVQGISGNGNIIATINYSGILSVYQRAGNTYNFLWQNQEPPGQFFNWYTGVDISNNGEYIAAGTLNFITSSSYDGKVKVFKRDGSGTPLWTYAGCGDEVEDIEFSANGNILAAASWGDFGGATDDFYAFKTFAGNVPLMKLNTPGSLFTCSISSDGRTVFTGGKAVHARQFGSGGLMYSINLDTSHTPTPVVSSNIMIPEGITLTQNYPNPFNPETKIRFTLPPGINLNEISMKLYDVRGNEVADILKQGIISERGESTYELKFLAEMLSSGVYFYRLSAEGSGITRSMILLK